jgi:hypothetical protein
MIDQEENNRKLVFSSYGLSTIKSLASVMKVFGVTTLILMGFLSLFYLYGFMQVFSDRVNGLALIPVLLVFAYIGCSIFMTLELLKASNAFRNYTQTMNSQNLDQAFSSLKLYWRYAGILLMLTIVSVILLISVWAIKFNAFSTSFQQ